MDALPTLQKDGYIILVNVSPESTFKTISFFNAFCVGLQTHFMPGAGGGGSLQMHIRISPQRVVVGAIIHDNNWPLDSHGSGQTHPKPEPPKQGWAGKDPFDLKTTPKPLPEKPPTKPPVGKPPTPKLPRIPRLPVPAPMPTALMTILLAMLPHEAGVANEWEQKLPEKEEQRYRELEAKRSKEIAKGGKLSPREEEEFQALDKQKYPYGRGGMGKGPRSGKTRTQEIGDAREQYVAEITGGQIIKDQKGNDIKLKVDNVGSTGLDVLGPNGEYIQVGGPAKGKDLADFSNKLSILRKAAERDGVEALLYLEEGTSPEVIKLAEKKLGKGNVHIFRSPQ